jgi:hypothetical protein
MKKILAFVRSARRQLVGERARDVSVARDIFFSRVTASLLRRRGIISKDEELSFSACSDALTREFGDAPQYMLRAATHEPLPDWFDDSINDAVANDPLVMGWAYQFWNDAERDTATTGISRRGEARTDAREIAVATQLFTEEYMASFLIERSFALDRLGSEVACDDGGDVLDPACGVGHILVPFLRALRAGRIHPGGTSITAMEALSRIHGCDIDETAVEICRVLLFVEALASSKSESKAAWSIVRRNIIHLPSPWGTLDRRCASNVLGRTYRYVITNPPYIGRRKLTEETRDFLDAHYPATSMDLCAAFMERCLELTRDGGILGLVTVDKWLRLKPYEVLRVGGKGFQGLYRAVSLDTVCELGQRAFGSVSGLHDGVGVCLLTATKVPPAVEHEFRFISAADKLSQEDKIRGLKAWQDGGGSTIRQRDLLRDGESTTFILRHGIPSRLVGSRRVVNDVARVVVGLQTSDDRRFVRPVWSVPPDRSRWLVHSKGGGYDRWFGLNRYLLAWREGRSRFEEDPKSGIAVKKWFDEEGWTYTWFANGALGLRRKEAGWSFGRAASSGVFCEDTRCVAFLNSRVASLLARRLGGKAQLPEGIVRSLPIPESFEEIDPRLVDAAVLLKRALVAHDPTDATFSPRRPWDPRELVGIQALLLLVEGILERQVCDMLRLSHGERRELDATMGTPAAWYGRRQSLGDDDVWSVIPESLRELRPLVESFVERTEYSQGARGECARYFESSIRSVHRGRPLPATSLMETISRGMALHPFDVALDMLGLIGTHRAATDRIVAPTVVSRIVTLTLTELGHQWWGDGTYDPDGVYPELSLGELTARVERVVPTVMKIPQDLVRELLGGSLEEWLVSTFRAAQLRVFSGTQLARWYEGRSGRVSAVRHVWQRPYATSADGRPESLERGFP